MREYLGGIYDWIRSHDAQNSSNQKSTLNIVEKDSQKSSSHNSTADSSTSQKTSSPEPTDSEVLSYAERKERQKQVTRLQKQVNEIERKISELDTRLSELDTLLCDPKNASDMKLVNEYTDVQREQEKAMETWEELSEKLEEIRI